MYVLCVQSLKLRLRGAMTMPRAMNGLLGEKHILCKLFEFLEMCLLLCLWVL